MNATLIRGAAAAAIIAATGPADAADVIPIAAVVTPAPVAAQPAAVVTAEIDWIVEGDWDPPATFDFNTELDGEIEAKMASGWGFRLTFGVDVGLALPIDGRAYVGGEAFRTIGNAQIGFFAEAIRALPFGTGGGSAFGPTFRYDSDRLEVRHRSLFAFTGGAYFGFQSGTEITFRPTDRIELIGEGDLSITGITVLDLVGEARIDLGVVTPFVRARLSLPSGFWSVRIGAELEQPLGSSPLWLIGGATFGFSSIDLDFDAYVGLRFKRGETD